MKPSDARVLQVVLVLRPDERSNVKDTLLYAAVVCVVVDATTIQCYDVVTTITVFLAGESVVQVEVEGC